MANLTRPDFLDVLQGDWATYVRRFQELPAEAQPEFLTWQGYARFVDLLAHIIAWWEVGYRAFENYLADPNFPRPVYDVDAFNAQVVARVKDLDEDGVIQSYERMRSFLIDFINQLPKEAFLNEKVVNQLNIELVDHLKDHDL